MNVKILFFTSFVIGFSHLGGIYFTFTNLLLHRLNQDINFIGNINAFSQIFLVLGSVTCPVLHNFFSEKRILQSSSLSLFVSLFLLSYTYLLDNSSRIFFFSVLHIASYFFLGILIVLLNPLVHKYSNKSNLKKNVSIQVALMILGGLLGSLFGGLIVKVFLHQFSYSNESVEPIYFAMFVASLFYILVFVFTFHFEVGGYGLDERTHQSQNLPKTIAARNNSLNQLIILIISVFIIFRLAGEYSLRIYFNLYLNNEVGIDLADIAFLFSVAQFVSLGGPLISLFLMNRFEEEKVFASATFLLGLAVLLIGVVSDKILIFCFYVFSLLCAQIARPSLVIITMKHLPLYFQTKMSGANIVAIGLSGFLVSYLGTILIDPTSYSFYFSVAGIISMASAIIFLLFIHRLLLSLSSKKSTGALS